jgi:hypothetical protein
MTSFGLEKLYSENVPVRLHGPSFFPSLQLLIIKKSFGRSFQHPAIRRLQPDRMCYPRVHSICLHYFPLQPARQRNRFVIYFFLKQADTRSAFHDGGRRVHFSKIYALLHHPLTTSISGPLQQARVALVVGTYLREKASNIDVRSMQHILHRVQVYRRIQHVEHDITGPTAQE